MHCLLEKKRKANNDCKIKALEGEVSLLIRKKK